MPLQQFDIRIADLEFAKLDDSTPTGSWSTSITPGNHDGIYPIVIATNDDTIDHNVTLSGNSSDATIIGEITIPAGSGYGGIARVDVVGVLLNTTMPYLLIPAGGSLWLKLGEAINTGKLVNLYLQGGLT